MYTKYMSILVASWSDGRTACKNDGGNLVSISDIHESGFVVTLAGLSSPFWIGLSDERVCLVSFSLLHEKTCLASLCDMAAL